MMELYSTALWHLQKEVALSALAQALLEQDRLSPAAWCATGNCFSLQKEHDSAIKFFQRAVQVWIVPLYTKCNIYWNFKNTDKSLHMCWQMEINVTD
jgi:tetratricopeptide (TPR) repeat protein